MLSQTEKHFSLLFAIIVCIELLTGSITALNTIHYIAKPAIVISLLVWFIRHSKTLSKTIRSTTILALIFSVLGDIFLLFVAQSPHFFTSGLVAFLTAHIMYILVFLKHRNPQKSAISFVVLLLVYAVSVFYFLNGNLGAMLIPVIIYMLVILIMATTAYLRKGKVNLLSYGLVFLGALFFLVSDSILALNKFYKPLAYSNYTIMFTYALAQYLIVIGLLKLNESR
ncbi:lysoplasmalogenase [Winogradskyella sediminis]|uniref:lysoplasmalogenase n=1 Tax=Winogradskyella sediminis TaxID=1382466 RepID=UPI000E239317|nr:lysoplasmalogenase [Winogradskyella sediminis]REG84632.1 putative membrane protein YhhN [Winogradskyella sediminis]